MISCLKKLWCRYLRHLIDTRTRRIESIEALLDDPEAYVAPEEAQRLLQERKRLYYYNFIVQRQLDKSKP